MREDIDPIDATSETDEAEAGGSSGATTTGAVAYAAYDDSLFVPNRTSLRVSEILVANRGGNYGLTGPRGAGKSWTMQHAIVEAEVRGGLGLWFPSPSEANPDAFLAAISDVFAERYIDHYLNASLDSTIARRRRRMWLMFLVAMALYLGASLTFFGLNNTSVHVTLLAAVGVTLLVAGAVGFVWIVLGGRVKRPSTVVYEKAIDVRRQARFAAVFSDSTEVTGGLSRVGASLGIKQARTSNFTERPPTRSSLVHAFRSFASEVATVFDGPLVIAIDELDKMEAREDVLALLRGVKGIFDVPHVHYFVSVSDEAARQLDLGAVTGRNEFNSSFYQVFALPPANAPTVSAMLAERGVSELDARTLTALAVLSGGVPREVVRLWDSLGDYPSTALAPECTILRAEVAAFAAEINRAWRQDDRGTLTEEDRLFIRRHLDPVLKTSATLAGTDVLGLWDCPGLSEAWKVHFAEHLHGLLVRLAVGSFLIRRHGERNDSLTTGLQEIVNLASLGDPIIAREALRTLSP